MFVHTRNYNEFLKEPNKVKSKNVSQWKKTIAGNFYDKISPLSDI